VEDAGETSFGDGFSSRCVTTSGGFLVLAAMSTVLPSSVLPASASSRLAGRKLGVGVIKEISFGDGFSSRCLTTSGGFLVLAAMSTVLPSSVFPTPASSRLAGRKLEFGVIKEISLGDRFSSWCLTTSGGFLVFAAMSTVLPSSAFPTSASSRLAGRELEFGVIKEISLGDGFSSRCITTSGGFLVLAAMSTVLSSSVFPTPASSRLAGRKLGVGVVKEISFGDGFSSRCVTTSRGFLVLAAMSTVLPSSVLPSSASSRLAGKKLGIGGIRRWSGCRDRVSRGWCNSALFSMCFVAMVLVAVMMRSFVVMRGCSASLGGRGRSGCSIGRGSIPDIVFLDVHIVHTGVKFSNVTIVTLNKIVGVLHGHGHHGSSVGKGGNKSESRTSGRHV